MVEGMLHFAQGHISGADAPGGGGLIAFNLIACLHSPAVASFTTALD